MVGIRRLSVFVVMAVLAGVLAGCEMGGERELLVVGFNEGEALEYKMVSQRDVYLKLASSKTGKTKTDKMSEKLELVMVYTPLEVNPYGLSTIAGECKSAKVTRKSFGGKGSGKDAVEYLVGRSFKFKLTPTGQITEYTELEDLLKEVGDKAFNPKKDARGRIKNADMLYDFIALHWYLWDSSSKLDDPMKGVSKGDTWKARQLVPMPILFPPMRETTYSLDEITVSDDGSSRKAIIKSTYAFAEETDEDAEKDIWPKPYEGVFQIKGMFGFLRKYKFLSIEGSGKQVFDLVNNHVESDVQQYKMEVSASFMLPLGDTPPMLTVDQKLTTELVK
jgi:hypothetical protein